MSRNRTTIFAVAAVAAIFAIVIYFVFKNREVSAPTRNHEASESSNNERSPSPRDKKPAPSPKERTGTSTTLPPIEKPPEDQPVVVPPPATDIACISGVVSDDQGGLPGLSVLLLDAAHLEPKAPLKMVKTDAAGKYRFDDALHPGTAMVAVIAEGWSAACSLTMDLTNGGIFKNVNLTVFAAADVRAKVLDGDKADAPLEGASVSVRSVSSLKNYTVAYDADGVVRLNALLGLSPDKQPHMRLTAKDGTLAVSCLPPGEYVFEARKSGYACDVLRPGASSLAAVQLKPGESKEVVFRLRQAGAVRGRVVAGEPPSPVAGAYVELGWSYGGIITTTVTGEDGVFRFDSVPVGRREQDPAACIRVQAASYAMVTQPVAVAAGAEKDLGDIVLGDKCGVIAGIVLNPAGDPVAGASVCADDPRESWQRTTSLAYGVERPKHFFSATTDANGQFSLRGLAADSMQSQFNVHAEAKGYARTTERIVFPGVEPFKTVVTLKLKAAGAISGHIFENQTAPIAGVRVLAIDEAAGFSKDILMGSLYLVDEDGRAGQYTLNVSSDADGAYTIPDLPEGLYTVAALPPRHPRQYVEHVQVKAGAVATVDFALSRGAAIFGTCYDAAGTPRADIAVRASSGINSSKGLIVRETISGSGGAYRIEGLPDGTYLVKGGKEAQQEAFPNLNPRDTVKITGTQDVEHDVYETVPGTTRIFGVVTKDGKPYTGNLVMGGGGVTALNMKAEIKCDEQGRYEATNVVLGFYYVIPGRVDRLFQNVLRRQEIRVSVLPEQEINIDFAAVSISGKVTLSTGQDLPANTEVFASPYVAKEPSSRMSPWKQFEGQLVQRGNVDAKTGVYSIEGLAPGMYWITARARTGGFTRKGPVTLNREVTGYDVEMNSATGTLKGTAENFVPPDDAGGPMSLFRQTGVLIIEDADGNPLNFGRAMPVANSIQLELEGDSGLAVFTRETVPVGTWTVTLQVSNYAPVTLTGVQIADKSETAARFTLSPSGHLEVAVTNSDLGPNAAQDLTYTITASNGQPYVRRFTIKDLMENMLNPPSPDKKNMFVLKDFAPDTYTIVLELPDYKPAKQAFTIVSGQTTRIDVTFEK